MCSRRTRDAARDAGRSARTRRRRAAPRACLLYTSDAADERSSVDLGGRRIIKKKKMYKYDESIHTDRKDTHQSAEK